MFQEGEVLLRHLIVKDGAALAQLANNKKIWDNVRDYFPHPYTREDAGRFIELTRHESPPLTFAIQYCHDLCGVVGLVGQSDVYRKTAEIGYWLGEPFWHKGIATTAVKLITAYGLHQLDFVRIHTGVFAYNTGSMRVLEKNGYQQEGVFRKNVFKNGHFWDEHRYAITK